METFCLQVRKMLIVSYPFTFNIKVNHGLYFFRDYSHFRFLVTVLKDCWRLVQKHFADLKRAQFESTVNKTNRLD